MWIANCRLVCQWTICSGVSHWMSGDLIFILLMNIVNEWFSCTRDLEDSASQYLPSWHNPPGESSTAHQHLDNRTYQMTLRNVAMTYLNCRHMSCRRASPTSGILSWASFYCRFIDLSLVFHSIIRVNFGESGDWCYWCSIQRWDPTKQGQKHLTFSSPDVQSRGKPLSGRSDSQHMQEWWMRMHNLILVT